MRCVCVCEVEGKTHEDVVRSKKSEWKLEDGKTGIDEECHTKIHEEEICAGTPENSMR